jgi:4'-phosphopantetheinyl transferase
MCVAEVPDRANSRGMTGGSPPPREVLPEDECHVWVVRVDEALVAEPERYLAWLSEDEIERVRRYRFDRHRREHLATRVLARAALSRYTGLPPQAWVFGTGPHGKPHVMSPVSPLTFNLTNTLGLVACAVARGGAVGVDVEPDLDRGNPLELAEVAFSPDELAALRATPEPERRDRFVAVWTLKEAYLKGRGLGLALSTTRFSIALEGATGARLSVDPALGDHPSRWQLTRVGTIPGFHLAVALARDGGADRQVRVRTSPTLDVHE